MSAQSRPPRWPILLPMAASAAVLGIAIAYPEAAWRTAMLGSSLAAMAVCGFSMVRRCLPLATWGTLIALSIGGIVSGAIGEGVSAAALLGGSIVAAALGVLGAMLERSRGGSFDGAAILEAAQLSENAKRVLFRDRELELMRSTIEADVERGDYNEALVLCEQMASVFGAVEEGERLRSHVQQILHERHELRIREELEGLGRLLEERRWVEAYQEAARLRRLFPDAPLLHGLEQRIADARAEYRHGLEDRFLDAAQREDIEQAMVLLKELDRYLTPDEARRFRDTAKAVIEGYRETLGTRFKMAVDDRRWQPALGFGEAIVQTFPNTRMAEEVTGMLETIRQRAEGNEEVEA